MTWRRTAGRPSWKRRPESSPDVGSGACGCPRSPPKPAVSTALAYYHFKDRAGILHRTLEFISDRAERCTVDRPAREYDNDPHRDLERSLLLEFQDRPEVRENSIAWGELQATAVFDPELRAALAGARLIWIGELTSTLARIR